LKLWMFARWGVSVEDLRAWRRLYSAGGPQALEPKPLGRPLGDGRSTLPERLQAGIVRTKRRFPTFGLKKVRDFLKRFGGQSVSTGSVRKVLAAEGTHGLPTAPRRSGARSCGASSAQARRAVADGHHELRR
jgi:hypothetical protein